MSGKRNDDGDFPTISDTDGGEATARPPREEAAPEIEGYRIIDRLSDRGGQGTVWRAVQLSTNREVALKSLRAGGFSSRKAQARFEREVEITASLEHPNIARVYDSGVHHGVYYYAMELIHGMDLGAAAEYHQPTRRQILELMRTVCQAVQHAHQRGIIHRDLKPSNIMVTPEGRPRVLDFGLAKTFLEADRSLAISVEGDRAGTPAYMSPEQAAGRGDELDTRTDVYSLGVILYELLTGQLPHDVSGTQWEVCRRIAEEEVRRPREVTREIDRELEALLLKALARDADSRYASAGDLAVDIDRYLNGEPLGARPPTTIYYLRKKIRKHRALLAIAIAALAVVVGLAAVGSLWWVGARQRQIHEIGRQVDGICEIATRVRLPELPRFAAKLREARRLREHVGKLLKEKRLDEARSAHDDLKRLCDEIRALDRQRRSALVARSESETAADAVKAALLHRGIAELGERLWGRAVKLHSDAQRSFDGGGFSKATILWNQARNAYVQAGIGAMYPVEPVGDLRYLGITVKDPEAEVRVYRGTALFDDLPRSTDHLSCGVLLGRAIPPSQVRVSAYRLPGDSAQEALRRYRSAYLASGHVHRVMETAIEAFRKRGGEVVKSRGFAAFLRANGEYAELLPELTRLAGLFQSVDSLGLGPVETEISHRIIAGKLKPKGLSVEQFLETVLEGGRRLPPTTGAAASAAPTSRAAVPARKQGPAGLASPLFAEGPGVPWLSILRRPPVPSSNSAGGEPVFRADRFLLSCEPPDGDLANRDHLILRTVVELGETRQGYVEPAAHLRSVKARFCDLSGLPRRVFAASALRAIIGQIDDAFRSRGIIGVFVSTDPEDIDPAGLVDKRPEGRHALRLLVRTAVIERIRTVGFSRGIPLFERINHPSHASIAENCPLRAGDLVRMDLVLEYAVRLSRRPGQHVNVAVSPGTEPAGVVLDLLVLGNTFQMPTAGQAVTPQGNEMPPRAPG